MDIHLSNLLLITPYCGTTQQTQHLDISRYADTLGAARKAGLHLSCGHDDRALSTAECILDNIGKQMDEAASFTVSALQLDHSRSQHARN